MVVMLCVESPCWLVKQISGSATSFQTLSSTAPSQNGGDAAKQLLMWAGLPREVDSQPSMTHQCEAAKRIIWSGAEWTELQCLSRPKGGILLVCMWIRPHLLSCRFCLPPPLYLIMAVCTHWSRASYENHRIIFTLETVLFTLVLA